MLVVAKVFCNNECNTSPLRTSEVLHLVLDSGTKTISAGEGCRVSALVVYRSHYRLHSWVIWYHLSNLWLYLLIIGQFDDWNMRNILD